MKLASIALLVGEAPHNPSDADNWHVDGHAPAPSTSRLALEGRHVTSHRKNLDLTMHYVNGFPLRM